MYRAIALLVCVAALFALVPSALAFTSQPGNPVTMSNKLADPDDIAEQISNGPNAARTAGRDELAIHGASPCGR